MKKTLQAIWKFVNNKIFGYILVMIFVMFFLGTCNKNKDLKDEITKKDQNISAMTDTIKTVIKKNGNLEVSIDGYIGLTSDLQNYNKKLADQVKAQSGKVVTLNNIVFNLRNDSTSLANRIIELEKLLNKPIQLNDSTWDIGWSTKYKDIGTVAGHSIIGVRANKDWLRKIELTNEDIIISLIDIPVEMTWGQKWEGKGNSKKLKIYAETNYPGFQTKLLEGTYADIPKQGHWFQGFGIGPQFDIGYDFLHNQPAVVIGIGIQYNFYKF